MDAHDQNTQQQQNNSGPLRRYNSGPLRGQLLAGAMEQWEERNAPITADLRDVHCCLFSSVSLTPSAEYEHQESRSVD